jgi:hypothetical protein
LNGREAEANVACVSELSRKIRLFNRTGYYQLTDAAGTHERNWYSWMAGQIKHMIDSIVEQRAKGNPTIALTTKTKLVLKGLNPDRFDSGSPDDPAVITKVKAIAADLGVHV